MLKRFLQYNVYFSTLFLLSFIASFIIMYYGMSLNRQFIRVSEVRKQSVYQYGFRIIGRFSKETKKANEILTEKTLKGNIIFQCDGPIGEGVINTDAIDVLWVQNESMNEPVKYERYYLNGSSESLSIPKCIIGEAWRDQTYKKGEMRFIKVYQTESLVIGEYVPNHFEGEDKRCLVFKDSLTDSELEKILLTSGSACVIYESNIADETDSFRTWVYSFFTEGNCREEEIPTNIWASSDGFAFSMFMALYQKAYKGMLVLCFINCAFLACFWGERHIYEFMLKKTLGYGKCRLYTDVVYQFLVYEITALFITLCITMIYELWKDNFSVWIDNIYLGLPRVALVFILFGAVLSMIPMIVILKRQPMDVLNRLD